MHAVVHTYISTTKTNNNQQSTHHTKNPRTRPPDAVDVDLDALAHVVVDHGVDVLDVEPAGGHVRRHEDGRLVCVCVCLFDVREMVVSI